MGVSSGVVTSEIKEAMLHGSGLAVTVTAGVDVTVGLAAASGVVVDMLAVTVCAACVSSKPSTSDWEEGMLHAKDTNKISGIKKL